ncbi:MAG: cation transporter [Candidatus Dadabacteria bacterium RBG_19FT_COMBO_40_33]|nr:MAG: cation transporter [Candidatus Dadabacteria bacterium RBG_19FT_COMBO_40_33]
MTFVHDDSDRSGHQYNHIHKHSSHAHTHGMIDPSIVSNKRGIWAIKWSFIGLFLTALLQIVVVLFSGSVALLADTIHNFGDAATAIPLWVAFALARLKPSKRFPYGLGRIEDIAGVVIVLIILSSAILAGYEAIDRLIHPRKVEYLWAIIAASVVGFLGNEAVAIFRIKVGKEIGSAALIADGYHARVDGWTSLAVLFGALGVWQGYPLADPIVGLLITFAILWIVCKSGKSIFTRMLDGVDYDTLQDIKHVAKHVEGVVGVSEVRARWIGHRLHAEVNISVEPTLSVVEGHNIAKEVRHQLLHHLPHLGNATIHVDPVDENGEIHHKILEHAHDNLTPHSHY